MKKSCCPAEDCDADSSDKDMAHRDRAPAPRIMERDPQGLSRQKHRLSRPRDVSHGNQWMRTASCPRLRG